MCVCVYAKASEEYISYCRHVKEFIEFVEGLTNAQFEKIQKFFESTPKLEHTFTVNNPNTGEPSEFTITGLSNFFG